MRALPTNADALWRHDEKLVKAGMVALKDVVEPSYLGHEGRVGAEPKEDHAHVGLTVAKDKLAKIGVVGDEDAALGMSETKHAVIWQTSRIVGAETRHIVTKGAKVWQETSVGAFIEQKSHPEAEGTGLRLVRLPSASTTAWA